MIKKRINLINRPPLMEEIKKVLKTVSYGSVEIYVQDSKVTQMTVRKIVKTKYNIHEEDDQTAQEVLKDKLKKGKVNIKTIQIGQNRVLTKEN